MSQRHPREWAVVDDRTGTIVGWRENRRRAKTLADRKDDEYGGYRFSVRHIDTLAVRSA